MRIKDFGQVFTPHKIVCDVLDAVGYFGEGILQKHIIDNSCGDGAFLTEIVNRYADAFFKKNASLCGIENDLKKYIHGIEFDEKIYQSCLKNLDAVCERLKILKVNFDIERGDALLVSRFNGKMDFVVGNPPYVRVHNLSKRYNLVKKFSFCESGMTDLFIVFYEIGLNMLGKNGILCYISPNSFFNSLAGRNFRKYIAKTQSVEALFDLGHYQPFEVTTYTAICKICKNRRFDFCKYFKYDSESGDVAFIANIDYSSLFVDDAIILADKNNDYRDYLNYDLKKNLKVEVKNGFATLNDKVFIQKDFEFENTIDVVKASTGQWKKCIFPYDKNGRLLPFDNLDGNLQRYFFSHKKELLKEKGKLDSAWYGFGRSQAINDVSVNKIAINTCIKNVNSIKLNLVSAGKGLYSGLYMITKVPFEKIREKICSEKFIDYLKLVNKCKSGGYYTFSSKDLSKFINRSLEEA